MCGPDVGRDWPMIRQTPRCSSRWGDAVFLWDERVGEADHLVVTEGITEPVECWVDPERTLLVLMEPPSVRRYDPRFAAQFAKVVTVHEMLEHPNRILGQPGSPWHVGMSTRKWHRLPYGAAEAGRVPPTKGYDDFAALDVADKPRELSVIASAKRISPGHVRRVDFVQRLLTHFGDRIDLFGAGFYIEGRGHVDLVDKMDGILPYKYHVVIENSQWPHYFTEKLTDCFLCGAMPIYHGCPNIHDYYPKESLIRIDIGDPEGAVAIIEEAIATDAFGRGREALAEARDLTLNRYNLYPMVEALCREPSGTKRKLTFMPEHMIGR